MVGTASVETVSAEVELCGDVDVSAEVELCGDVDVSAVVELCGVVDVSAAVELCGVVDVSEMLIVLTAEGNGELCELLMNILLFIYIYTFNEYFI